MENEKWLIDANALKSFCCEYCNAINSDEPCEPADCRCMYLIDEMPTVDAVEVVHGRWEQARYTEAPLYICSKCDKAEYKQHNYCPNCGADMRERKGNET